MSGGETQEQISCWIWRGQEHKVARSGDGRKIRLQDLDMGGREGCGILGRAEAKSERMSPAHHGSPEWVQSFIH